MLPTAFRDPIRVFVAAAHEDILHKKALLLHLSVLRAQNMIAIVSDRGPGDAADQFERAIRDCDLLLVLVSPDLFSTSSSSLYRAIEACRRDGHSATTIVPILLRPFDSSGHFFSDLQALPSTAEPIVNFVNRDDAWKDVSLGVRAVVQKLRSRSHTEKPPALFHLPPIYHVSNFDLHTRRAPGTAIGHYVLTTMLGSGRTSSVWEARSSEDSNLTVAIKIPHHDVNVETIRRSHREARMVASIDNPHVCRLVAVLRSQDADFLAFERLFGETLQERKRGYLRGDDAMPLSAISPIICDTLRGLSSVHAAGIVHRDLTPSNLFIATISGERGASSTAVRPITVGKLSFNSSLERTKILDFGLAKLTRIGAHEQTLTSSNAFWHARMMDPSLAHFSAPEVLDARQRGVSADVDERADIYSVGVIIGAMLASRFLFPLKKVLDELHRGEPHHFLDTISAELADLLRISTSPDPEDRYQSARSMLDAWTTITSQ